MTEKIYHIRDNCCGRQTKGAITIATNLNTQEQYIEYGISLCSPKDQFTKKVGREIAINRLNLKSKWYRSLDIKENKIDAKLLLMYILMDIHINLLPTYRNNWAQSLIISKMYYQFSSWG